MITKQKIQTVQEKIKQAIAKIEQEEQVSIKFGNRSYNNSMYSTKMTVTTTAQDNSTVQAVDSVNTRILGKNS
jgi:hypothetical protein